MRKRLALAVLGVAAPVVALAPPSQKRGGARTIDDVAAPLRNTGLQGADLVNAAIAAVADEYTHYSSWHIWELPQSSLARGRGWSHQYNTVLLEVLRRLGFEARLVHAARMRRADRPWFHSGHTWVKVQVDGRWRDACASRASNRIDELPALPSSEELPFHNVTRLGIAVAYSPFLVATVWSSWLRRRPVPAWLYRPRGE